MKLGIRMMAATAAAAAVLLICVAGCSSSTEEKGKMTVEKTPDITAEGIRAFSLMREGKECFSISYQPSEYRSSFDYWDISIPYESKVSVNTETMYQLYETVASLEFNPIADAQDSTWSADNSFTVEYTSDSDAQAGDKKACILIGNQNADGDYYAVVQGYEENVFLLPRKQAERIMGLTPFDYILRVVSLINIDTVSELKIKTADGSYTMEQEDDSCRVQGKEIGRKEYQSLYSLILSPPIEKELDSTDRKSPQQQVLELTYIRKDKEAAQSKIVYSTYDRDYYSVKVDETEQFLVNREAVDMIIHRVKSLTDDITAPWEKPQG